MSWPDIPPRTLTVTHPAGQYEVVVGTNLLSTLSERVSLPGALAVISDENVAPLYGPLLSGTALQVIVPAGERHKTLDTVRDIYDQLLAHGMDRRSTLVALGGGVVGDIAGFVAATYLRGVRFVQCPTSLLAMVDASVGGKTGVDMPQGKNLVGAFKQPEAVLVDLPTLTTLPPRERRAGMAEVVKHGLLNDPALYERCRQLDLEAMSQEWDRERLQAWQALLLDAIQVKRDVVVADPFESGRRALLNLGHTFAHALEQVSHYAIIHGEAVAMGLVAAARLSARLGFCKAALAVDVAGLLNRLGLPVRIPADFAPAAIYEAMGSDKKKAAGALTFVLLRGIGDAFLQSNVPPEAVLDTLADCQEPASGSVA